MSTNPEGQFYKRVYSLAGGLVALCLLFTMLTLVQGARVRSVTVDGVGVTLQSNQRLLLQFNQSPSSVQAKDITVTPKAAFSAVTGGKTIALQFAHPLRNSTQYNVHIKTSQSRTIKASFVTPAAHIYYIVNTEQDGSLLRRNIDTGKDETVLTGKPIQDYLVLGKAYIVSYKEDTGNVRRNTVVRYDRDTLKPTQVTLPDVGVVDSLQASADGQTFGLLFAASNSTDENYNMLLTGSVEASVLRQVTSFNNKPLQAREWQFARNSTTIAALTFDATLLLINPNIPPIPLGQYNDFKGFTHDDSGVVVDDMRAGKQIVTLRTGAQVPLPVIPGPDYLVSVAPLNTEAGTVYRVLSYKGEVAADLIRVNRESGQKQVFYLDSDDGYIATSTLSPNDHYLALEINKRGREDRAIKIIDTFSGKTITAINGTLPQWVHGSR